MRADVHRFTLTDPSDVSGLAKAIEAGTIDPSTIVAVIGKTHGNGLVNDYTRGYLTLCLSILIGEASARSPETIREQIPFIFSGGTEGVLSPHYTVFTVVEDGAVPVSGEKALAIGVAFTLPMRPSDIGRQAQIDAIAAAVTEAVTKSGIEEVHYVQVKGPAFSLADIVGDQKAGRPPVSDNPGKLMGFGRAASALGVAAALDEVAPEKAVESAVLKDFSLFSSVASMSAGIEIRCNEVVVVGMSSRWTGPLVIEHSTMSDALDVGSVQAMLQRLGFPAAPQIATPARVRAAFIKCEASRDGLVRGKPHTMLNDGDINEQRHIRGAVGAICASILNDTALFVSGGAEHQGPDGGGMIAVVAEKAAIIMETD
jgi:cyanuric acid amidohydrolase